MKQVRYREIEDGEIFLSYSCNYRKSVTIQKKLSYNYHRNIISWDVEKAKGKYYVQETISNGISIFILKMSQSVEQHTTCFRLTDKELERLVMDII